MTCLHIWRRDGADPVFPESPASSTRVEFIYSKLGLEFTPLILCLVCVGAVDGQYNAQRLNVNIERAGACILSLLLPLAVNLLHWDYHSPCCWIHVCQENPASFTLQCFCSAYLFILQGSLWCVRPPPHKSLSHLRLWGGSQKNYLCSALINYLFSVSTWAVILN